MCSSEVTNITKTNKQTLLLNPFLLFRSFCPEQNQTAVTGLGLSINLSLACGSRWFKSSSERQRSLVCCWLNPALSFTFVYRGSGQQTDSHIHTHTQTHTKGHSERFEGGGWLICLICTTLLLDNKQYEDITYRSVSLLQHKDCKQEETV